MQNDLDSNHPGLDIHILGINEYGYEDGNEEMTSGRDIPWLQDVDDNGDGESDVWTSWAITLRDVVILDGENVVVGTLSLTLYDLQSPENYDTLRQMFIDAAVAPGDINADGNIDLDDLPLFIDILLGLDPDMEHRADMNGDGFANGLDTQQFAEALVGS